MVLASLLNTQYYKVKIKGKVELSREGVAPSPTPHFIFGMTRPGIEPRYEMFVGFSINRPPRKTILGVRRPDSKGNVIAKTFPLVRLGSHIYLAEHRILLPDVRSSGSHTLDPDSCCRYPCWVWELLGRWRAAWRHHSYWQPYISWCGLGV